MLLLFFSLVNILKKKISILCKLYNLKKIIMDFYKFLLNSLYHKIYYLNILNTYLTIKN